MILPLHLLELFEKPNSWKFLDKTENLGRANTVNFYDNLYDFPKTLSSACFLPEVNDCQVPLYANLTIITLMTFFVEYEDNRIRTFSRLSAQNYCAIGCRNGSHYHSFLGIQNFLEKYQSNKIAEWRFRRSPTIENRVWNFQNVKTPVTHLSPHALLRSVCMGVSNLLISFLTVFTTSSWLQLRGKN